jgi:hypothetical protein
VVSAGARVELKANLSPAGPRLELEHLLQTYLDRLTMYIGCEVTDQTFTLCAFGAYALADQVRLSGIASKSGLDKIWDVLLALCSGRNQRFLKLLKGFLSRPLVLKNSGDGTSDKLGFLMLEDVPPN